MLSTRLRNWQSGDLVSLWEEARADAKQVSSSVFQLQQQPDYINQRNARKALSLAREGQYGKAMRILGSAGCAPNDDISALDDLRQRHPTHDLPHWSDNVPPPLVVDSTAVIATLQAFPRGSSPGGSKLRPQHLLDAICGTSSPFAGHCLDQLTYFMNKLLSGKLDRRIGPWLSGAPLTALRKKPSGFRPIAVGEVLRRLASRLCCSAVRPYLPDIFLPYGQVGVGVKGGLEAAVHGLRKLIVDNSQNDELCCAKVDMRNAFNECRRSSFLH